MKKYGIVFGILVFALTVFAGCDYQAGMDDAVLLQQEGKNTAVQGDGSHETFQAGCELTCCSGNGSIDFGFEYTTIKMYPGQMFRMGFKIDSNVIIDYENVFIDVVPRHILDVQLSNDGNLLIEALLSGEAVITARYRGQETKCTVLVKNNVDLILSSYRIDLFPREKEYLTYTLSPPGLGPVLAQLNTNAFVNMQHIPEDNTIVLTGYEIGETLLYIVYNGVREQVTVIVHPDNFPDLVLDKYELTMVPGDSAILRASILNVRYEDYHTQLKWRIDESSSRIVNIVPSGDNRAAYIFALEPGRVKIEAVFSYPFMPESESIIRVCWITVEEPVSFEVYPTHVLVLSPGQIENLNYKIIPDVPVPLSIYLNRSDLIHFYVVPENREIRIEALDNGITGEVEMYILAPGVGARVVTIRVQS